MNESILLRVFHENQPVPVSSLDRDKGVVLGNETSAAPIGGGIALFPAGDDISKTEAGKVRAIEDWPAGEFRFSANTLHLRILIRLANSIRRVG